MNLPVTITLTRAQREELLFYWVTDVNAEGYAKREGSSDFDKYLRSCAPFVLCSIGYARTFGYLLDRAIVRTPSTRRYNSLYKLRRWFNNTVFETAYP